MKSPAEASQLNQACLTSPIRDDTHKFSFERWLLKSVRRSEPSAKQHVLGLFVSCSNAMLILKKKKRELKTSARVVLHELYFYVQGGLLVGLEKGRAHITLYRSYI